MPTNREEKLRAMRLAAITKTLDTYGLMSPWEAAENVLGALEESGTLSEPRLPPGWTISRGKDSDNDEYITVSLHGKRQITGFSGTVIYNFLSAFLPAEPVEAKPHPPGIPAVLQAQAAARGETAKPERESLESREVVALLALNRHGVPQDVLEMLTLGDGRGAVPPGALRHMLRKLDGGK